MGLAPTPDVAGREGDGAWRRPLTDEATRAVILELVNEAAAAHGVSEENELGGVRDDAWPAWCTDHLVRSLTAGGYRLVRSGRGPASDSHGAV
ncbi:hypothetical protein [Plantibacter sp. YIM 135249]|uniref:hypothetical protein n=1 Tax=Plantibacter sp. YIM 135249 TaxID=3423918 RepID=UPI003D34E126